MTTQTTDFFFAVFNEKTNNDIKKKRRLPKTAFETSYLIKNFLLGEDKWRKDVFDFSSAKITIDDVRRYVIWSQNKEDKKEDNKQITMITDLILASFLLDEEYKIYLLSQELEIVQEDNSRVFENISLDPEIIAYIVSNYINDTTGIRKCCTRYRRLLRKIYDLPPISSQNDMKSKLNRFFNINPGQTDCRTNLLCEIGSTIKFRNGLMKAKSFQKLKDYLKLKTETVSDRYDDISSNLKRVIEQACENLETAKQGTQVGRSGRYINSDDVAAAEQKLYDAYREADKWIGKNQNNAVSTTYCTQ